MIHSNTTTIFDHPVHYLAYEWTRWQTILILHGRWWSSASRKTIGEWLHKLGYTVLIPDLPGFGDTPLPHAFTIEDYGQRVKEFIIHNTEFTNSPTLLKTGQANQFTNSLNNQFTIIGHSNGGRIALSSISQGLLKPDQLILINSAGIDLAHDPSLIRTTKRMLWKHLAQIFKYGERLPWYRQIRNLLYKLSGGRDYLKASADPLMKQTFTNCFNYFCEEQMQTITIPTLLLRGERDTYTPLRQGKKMHSLIQDSTLVICKGQRHGIHLHDPKRVIWDVHHFLSS